jgi:hypothetical protein
LGRAKRNGRGWSRAIQWRRTHAGRLKLFNLLNIDGRLAPLIDAVRLRGLNAFELAFAPEVRFEFSEDAKHVEERFARSA